MANSVNTARWRDYNGWTKACRIVGELTIAGVGSLAAAFLGTVLLIQLHDLSAGESAFCEQNKPCDMAMYLYTVLQAPFLFLGGFYFLCTSPSNFRRTMFVVIAPVALAVAVLGDASLIATGLLWKSSTFVLRDYLTVFLWHVPSFACAAFLLLLYMTGWRRFWVTTRSPSRGAEI